jgi:hypothetical protein
MQQHHCGWEIGVGGGGGGGEDALAEGACAPCGRSDGDRRLMICCTWTPGVTVQPNCGSLPVMANARGPIWATFPIDRFPSPPADHHPEGPEQIRPACSALVVSLVVLKLIISWTSWTSDFRGSSKGHGRATRHPQHRTSLMNGGAVEGGGDL